MKQKQIDREVEDIYLKLQKDSRSYPYLDKVESQNRVFTYKFEDGESLVLDDRGDNISLIYTNKIHSITYSLGNLDRRRFIDLCNNIINNSRMRPGGPKDTGASNGYKQQSKAKTTADDPKRDRYESLKNTVNLRREQLSKMKKTDPEYNVLKNELEAAENALNSLKSKYKYENMKHIFKYGNFINEDIETTADSNEYSELKEEITDMIKKSLNSEDDKVFKDFIEASIKSPDDVQIEGLINDSDVYEFYLKFRNDIDDILSDINFYDEVPSEMKVFSLYEYIIQGTKKSVSEIISILSEDQLN